MTMEHLNRSFAVSLHVRHPSLDPSVITEALQLVPERVRSAGPPRKPPFDWTHWSYSFECDGVRDLSPYLEGLVATQLQHHRDFFQTLLAGDGTIELFCGIKAEFNWDEIVSPWLMRSLADLGIQLRLDVYPQSTISAPTT